MKNAYVKNGILTITAIKEPFDNNNYTSARLVSKNKKDFLYGRFEIKAKLPSGVGTWPAIWMLGSQAIYGENYWPANGELDIMEHVGYDQHVIHANIHCEAFNHLKGTNKGDQVKLKDSDSQFHIYSMDWTPDYISFAIDGVSYFEFKKEQNYSWEEWPFDQKFHLLLNIAVGGNWGGQKGVDDTIFPQSMSVDYVRYYELMP